mmetsp:Transcript_114686/g.364506  ORF Transcript_114686/g.364506 Transcript_114686/m.364506 type:complete len:601 (-) Transcript_114686:1196-2998(-)
MCDQLIRLLRGRIQGGGLVDDVGLGEGGFLVQAVHRARRSKDDARHRFRHFADFQQVHEALNIRLDVRMRILGGIPHARLSSQRHHVRELVIVHKPGQHVGVVQIKFQRQHAILLQDLGPGSFEAGGIVRVVVVDAQHAITPLLQRTRKVESDEASRASDQNHPARRGLAGVSRREPPRRRREGAATRHRERRRWHGLVGQDVQLAISTPALADGMHLEPDVLELPVVQNVPAIEDERRLHHHGVELVIRVSLELVPLGQHDDRMGAIHRVPSRALENEAALVHLHVMVLELGHSILLMHLRIEHVHHGPVLHQHVAHGQRRGLPNISGVLLEGEAQHCDLLVGDRVEQARNDLATEALLLVLVHVNNLLPILGDSGQALRLTDVDQIQNVLLEARAAEADGRTQELGPNARVGSNGSGYLGNICSRLLAQERYRVDAAHSLCQHSVGDQFGQLRAPQVCRQDSLSGDPIRVDINQDARSGDAIVGCRSTDQDTIRHIQILHGCTLCEELRVRKDPKSMRALVCSQHSIQGLGGPHWHRGLLDDDLVAIGTLCDCAAHALDEPQVGCAACPDALDLRRGVNGGEDDVGLLDGTLYICGEE